MNSDILDAKHLASVERESADQTFWCEPVDLADKEESSSRGKDFSDSPAFANGSCACRCGCRCSRGCSCN